MLSLLSETMGDANVQNSNRVEGGGVQGANIVQSTVHNLTIHMPEKEKFSHNYQRIKIIGRGTFGDVWKVKSKHVFGGEDIEFVMKEVSCSDQDKNNGKQEIEILKQCSHENIVQFLESYVEEGKLLIVMEFCRGGDLMELIKKQKPNKYFPESTVFDFFKQITSGTVYIHSKKILHRDLKPSNIFILSDNHLKIGDFGISKRHNSTMSMANTLVGTTIYIAPEIYGGVPYNEKADVWSLGCILYELASLQPAFGGHNFFLAIAQVFNLICIKVDKFIYVCYS